MAQSSKIFRANRALGYVSNHIPLVIRYIKCRKENLVVTCVGRSFHTYDSSHFTLLSVSGLHPEEITCLAADPYHVYTACGSLIQAWRRGTEVKHSYLGHESPVHLLLPFGPHLLSVDESNVLKVWDIKSEELHLELAFDSHTFQITTILHPNTYLNKILLGSEQGSLQLWNINSSKQIYVFKGWASPITVLEQAPAIDVVAVGLESGRIILHNLKYDETVMEFMQDWGIVTSLSFRTDGHPILVSGSLAGHIVIWNLEERKVMSQVLNAHQKAVNGLRCLPCEPLMASSSSDNSLQMWIFDLPDGGARQLIVREGHGAPPTSVRFYGVNGHNLLSSGGDSSLRIFSTLTETFNKSLGRASYNRNLSKKKKKYEAEYLVMPPITQFASEVTREKDWDNIAALHLGLPHVTTWSYDKLKMGDLKLLPNSCDSKKTKIMASCLCMTSCGNFVVVGYSTGHVERFNMQSGIHRASYGKTTAHKCPVRGVATDNLNKFVVTGGSDAVVKFWGFKSEALLSKVCVDEAISFFKPHLDSAMLAIALEDFTVVVMDLDTRTVVRKFQGHSSQVTDATFSPDARWLITCGMDCTVRTWDIPSSQLIDCFQVGTACTSLSMSPIGDLLATTHVGCLGAFLWSNQTLYSHVSLSRIPEVGQIPLLELPTTQGEVSESHEDVVEEKDEGFKSAAILSEHLVTMSQLATSRWQNLLNIDIVRKRNKPREPPRAPKAAPFFLPTIPSLSLKFDFSKEATDDAASKLVTPAVFHNLTAFGKILTEETGGFEKAIAKLKEMGPSALDLEVASLPPEAGGSEELMLRFMQLLEAMLKSNQDFELAQAYLALFLKTNGELIVATPSLRDMLPAMQACQNAGWETLQSKLLYSLCVVQTIKGM